MKITVAGVGYVGLSLAVLLAQHHEVTAITTTPAKADKLNQLISPIQDDEIERFFAEAKAGKRRLDLTTTTDKDAAYRQAELVFDLPDKVAGQKASAAGHGICENKGIGVTLSEFGSLRLLKALYQTHKCACLFIHEVKIEFA